MKIFSLKALGAFTFAAGLVVAGVAAPAQAAVSAGTISQNTFTAGTGTPGFTYTTGNSASGWTEISYTAQWANNPEGFQPKNGCTGNNLTFANCAITSIQVGTTTYSSASGVTLSAISNSNSYVPQMKFTFPSSQSGIVIVTFAPGAWVPSQINGTYPFKATTNGSDSYTVDVTVTGAKSTVFMNANIPNDYSMERQQASSPTALTANPFTRSGYSFAGWATSPTGAAVYADGAQFNFFGPTSFNQSGAITQLFAVWTQGSGGSGGSGGSSSSTPEVLANTGIDKTTGISLLAGGLSLALVGAEMFMIARRKRSN